MRSKKFTSLPVLMMSVIIMLGAFCLPASAATSIKKTDITLKQTSYVYSGKAFKPAVTVKNGKTKLKEGTHYTVAYKNNKNVGKATVTVTGKGSYNQKATKYFYITPKAVSSLKATAYADKVKLSWSKATGATAYEIQQKIDGKWKKVATTSKASYSVTDLDGATKYEFRVRATAKAGTKALNSSFKSISKTTTIGKVSGISASAVTESTATLKWSKVQGATSYRVLLTNTNTGFKRTLTATTNSLNLTSLDALSTYSVKITALNKSKNLTGAESAAYTFNTAPSAVKNLTATVSDTSVKLTWSTVFGADGYMVYCSKFDASGKVVSTQSSKFLTSNTCTVTGLTPCSYYVFKVVAGVKDTNSGSTIYSKPAETDKILIPVTKVPGFNATASGTDSIVLTWTRPANIDGYKIYKDNALVTTLEPSVTTYTLTGLTAGKSYKVGICAFLKNINEVKIDGEKTELTVTTATGNVQSISFVSRPSSLKAGETYQLSVKITPDNAVNKSVTYSSSDTAVAVVSADGVITAKAAGTTTIKATSQADSSKTAAFNLTVNPSSNPGGNQGGTSGDTVKVQGVTLKDEITLYEGDIISLNPTFTPENATNKSYSVTGSNEGSYEFSKYISITSTNLIKADKATVDSNGNAFSFTVTIRTVDGNKTASTRVKVLPRMITVSYNGIDALPWYCGNSAKLSTKLHKDIENSYSSSDIRFKSDNTSIATVANDGTVTCKGVGDVVITAYTSDGKYSGDFKLYSRKGLSIARTLFSSCQVGKTYQISANIIPSAGNDEIVYSSANSSIATVDNKGLVTFKAPGSVAISVHNSSDPFNPKQVWLTSNSFTAPSGSPAALLSAMKTSANAVKSRQNLPSVTRFDETVTRDLTVSSNKVSASDLQDIFNGELSPKTAYYSSVVSSDSQYTTLKKQFMNKVPVSDQNYIISPDLKESDIKDIAIINNSEDYYYEMKLTLKDESLTSLPTNASATRHGKVFDILTNSYIDTYLNKINTSNSMSITYSSFAQTYKNSTLTLKINKATGNVERATFDMNIDINISKLKMTYTVLLFPTSITMDVTFSCNNIVVIDFKDYR